MKASSSTPKINENRCAVPQNIYFAFSLLVGNVPMGPDICVGTHETFHVYQHLRKCRQYETVILCLTNVTQLHNHLEDLHVVLGQVHSLSQCELSGQCALVIFCEFPVSSRFLKVIHQLPTSSSSYFLPFMFPSVTCFRRQFLRKMWPIQLAFFRLIICRTFLFFLTVFNTFFTRSDQLIFSVLLQRRISKPSCFYDNYDMY
jgi:hypothetical protein